MQAKKLPESDEDRIKSLNQILIQEELANDDNTMLSLQEVHEIRCFVLNYEGAWFCFKQAMEDETKAEKSYTELFQTAKIYISHFIQVLNLAIIRGEVKAENLIYYGLENRIEFPLPDLSTESTLLEWGERLIAGENERSLHGGSPIYNPAISKVKVHFDLFKEALQSLKIYRQNTFRLQAKLKEMREKADRLLWDTWTKIEFTYWELPETDREKKMKDYGAMFFYQAGVQLNVFG
ncbi:MAG: hypothetical protein LBG77_08165 [Dysgonamonadaceae bacterium]|jgi:hypothetical protein|nr:hypothetical protein [Dysgonamonadaceae bacterium]